MTIKEKLQQEISETPDLLLEQALNFLLFIKSKRMNSNLNVAKPTELSEPTERHSTAGSLLKHFGTWEGDDLEDCLEVAVSKRTDISELNAKAPLS